jgi:hypothetical protein
MKAMIAIVFSALLFGTACSGSSAPQPCQPPDYKNCGTHADGEGLTVQIRAGNRTCDGALVSGDVVVTSSSCLAGASLADVSVEVDGEVISAAELRSHREGDFAAIRVAHAFSVAGEE